MSFYRNEAHGNNSKNRKPHRVTQPDWFINELTMSPINSKTVHLVSTITQKNKASRDTFNCSPRVSMRALLNPDTLYLEALEALEQSSDA